MSQPPPYGYGQYDYNQPPYQQQPPPPVNYQTPPAYAQPPMYPHNYHPGPYTPTPAYPPTYPPAPQQAPTYPPVQQQPASYPPPQPMPYPQAYPPPHSEPPYGANMAASQNAYGQNATRIPGVGGNEPPPLGGPAFPPPPTPVAAPGPVPFQANYGIGDWVNHPPFAPSPVTLKLMEQSREHERASVAKQERIARDKAAQDRVAREALPKAEAPRVKAQREAREAREAQEKATQEAREKAAREAQEKEEARAARETEMQDVLEALERVKKRMAKPPRQPRAQAAAPTAVAQQVAAPEVQAPIPIPPPISPPKIPEEAEEGELSEGQFEDLYDPVTTNAPPTVKSSQQPKAPQSAPQVQTTSTASVPVADDSDRESGMVDELGAGLYNEEEGEIVADAKSSAAPEPDRGASYSPLLSPREVQSDDEMVPQQRQTPHQSATAEPAGSTEQVRPANQASVVPGLQRGPRSIAPSQVNGSQVNGTHLAQNLAPLQPAIPNLQDQNSKTAKMSARRWATTEEARKEAKQTILSLWHHGVRYQTYIDEGFDETFIKGLFEEMNLETTSPNPFSSQQPSQPSSTSAPSVPNPPLATISSTAPISASEAQESAPEAQDTTKMASDASKAVDNASKVADNASKDNVSKGEERKDRIARLLAAKKNKSSTITVPVQQTTDNTPKQAEAASAAFQSSVQSATSTVAQMPSPSIPAANITIAKPVESSNSRPRVLGEKERIIHERIKQLEQTRNAMTQQSEIGNMQRPASVPMPSTMTTPPMASQADALRPSFLPIPGLSVAPTGPSASSGTARKRPVAADFVEYSSPVGPIKRPHHATDRHNSRVVSDASDAGNGEMEMEIDSQQDAASLNRSDSPRRQVREFPPLSDFIQRNYSGPSFATFGAAANDDHNAVLAKKEREIEEMRRKIADAVAKRTSQAQQTRSTSQTPQPAADRQPENVIACTATPEAPSSSRVTSESMRLPRANEIARLDKDARAKRRMRIMSLELPSVDSDVEEKLRRIEDMREEQRRLQAEVERILEKKQRLNDELVQLDDPVTEEMDKSDSEVQNGNSDSEVQAVPEDDVAQVENNDSGAQVTTDDAGAQANTNDGGAQMISTENGARNSEVSSRDASETTSMENQTMHMAGSGSINNIFSGQTTRSDADASDKLVQEETSSTQQTSFSAGTVNNPTAQVPDPDFKMLKEPDQDAMIVDDDDDQEMSMDEEDSDEEDSDAGAPIAAEEPIISNSAALNAPAPVESQGLSGQHPEQGPLALSRDGTPAIGIVNPGGQLDHDDSRQVAVPKTAEAKNTEATEHSFRPYDSPLKYFRAYRFHPQFFETVPGGLKSMTYSNKIQPKQQLCPFELAKQPCPNPCPFQHFQSMAVPDQEILIELGKCDDLSAERKAQYIAGLKQILKSFRDNNKVKDFDALSKGIIKYRAEFLGDAYRVLPLDGVSI